MTMKKLIAMGMSAAMLAGLLAGCSAPAASGTSGASGSATVDASAPATADGEVVTLNYWTWFPSVDQAKDVVAAFEKENPNIKINMTVMESKTYQEKAPLALSTNEDIDIIGVQPNIFATQVADYLAELDPLMEQAAGANWKELYSPSALERGNALTDGKNKLMTLVSSGSMFGFVNMDLLKDIGAEIPKTIEEYKAVAEKLKAKYPDKYAGVFAGKDGWVCDEMMLTVMAQQNDYYDEWRYNGASVESEEFINAFNDFKKFFDEGIFTHDTMDLDYAGAQEAFANGEALVYYMGSWDAPLLSEKLREQNGVGLTNVGVMALPTVREGSKLAVRSFLDSGIGIVNYSKKQEAAAKFVAYISVGEGADIMSNQLMGPSGKVSTNTDQSLFGTEEEKAGWQTINDMIANATSDRNNVSGFSDIEGAAVQSVINGSETAEEVVKSLQQEWTSGKY